MDKKELQQEIERAASTLLTDDEICKSLGITAEELDHHYAVVERTRIKLKQRLNAKRINDAATSGDPTELVASIPRNNKPKISSRGGARPGSGRKPGTTNKISATQILASIEVETGEEFGTLLAQGYAESIQSNDRATRLKYEQMILNKVVAEKVEVDVNESESAVERKQAAFQEVLRKLTGIDDKAK